MASPKRNPQRDDYLRKHYATTATALLAQELQLTQKQVRSRAAQLGIKKLPQHRAVHTRVLSAADRKLLRKHFAHKTNGELMQMIPVSRTAIAAAGSRMGLKKTPETRKRAWAEGGRNSKPHAGHFKSGQPSPRNAPVGTETWTTPPPENPDGPRYLKRKLPPPHGWQYMHRWLWIQAHGPVPPKHVITFRDGNSANLSLENLRCAPIGDLIVERAGTVPPELVPAYRLSLQLAKVIKKREKKS